MFVCLIVHQRIPYFVVFFSSMTLRKTHVHTISGPIPIIDGFENATIVLPKGTILHIENAFVSSR